MQEEGYVAAILYPDGAKDVELGKIVAVIVEDEADVAAFKDYDPSASSAAAAAPQQAAAEPTPAAPSQPAAAPQQAASSGAASGDKIFVSPLAKRMAEEKGYSLD